MKNNVLQNYRSSIASKVVMLLLIFTLLSLTLYFIVRLILFYKAGYVWQDKVIAFFLILAESFILFHSVGYFRNLIKVLSKGESAQEKLLLKSGMQEYPLVAIIVSSFREPIAIVEDTLTCFYNLSYPNKRIYFLDDTRYDLKNHSEEEQSKYRSDVESMCKKIGVDLCRRKWRGAKAGMINDFLHFINGEAPDGFEYYNYSDKPKSGPEEYIIIFDADQNPFPDFAEPLIQLMEDDPSLAFVQTPQYYTNFEHNRVARASGLQQVVFFEYICEGKGEQDAMFCCGTNVVFRTKALLDVGGLDESTVTEDFATSLDFHLRGWNSKYVSKVCAFGMGAEDLGGFFRQQFRWALGCVSNSRKIIRELIRGPRRIPPSIWFEYLLSGTYYYVGWAFFIMMLCPVLFLFFELPTFFAYPAFYFLFFLPYVTLSLSLFFWTLYKRNYYPFDILSGMILIMCTFPVYMYASFLATLGIKGTFRVTPKGQSKSLPMIHLWPQIIMALVSLSALVWGLMRIYYEDTGSWGLLLNSFWCFFFFLVLSSVFYFNKPVEE
jgi:cellulose synthase (UDP-forming)